MGKRRRRGWWLLAPILMILALFALPPRDDFAAFAREGKAISPEAFLDVSVSPPEINDGAVPLHPGCRVRAWALGRSRGDVADEMRRRGFTSIYGIEDGFGPQGRPTFLVRGEAFVDEWTGTEVTVLEGTKVPKGFRCVVMVQEPTGPDAAWRRFRARLRL